MQLFGTKEPISNLQKPIIQRVNKNHEPLVKGLYYLSADMNLQPGNLQGYCYSVVKGKVNKFYLNADYDKKEL